MIVNELNVYIADKSIIFGTDVRFGIPIKIKIGHTWKSTYDAWWRHKNGGKIYWIFSTFNPMDKISQNLVVWRKI